MTRRIPLGNSFGVMQGRLSQQTTLGYQAFPVTEWRDEFQRARERHLEHIEWIVDSHALWDNPILQSPKMVEALTNESGVAVRTLCADIFMDLPLAITDEKSFDVLSAILDSMRVLEINCLVLPCVDQASLLHPDQFLRLKAALPRVIDMASDSGVAISLESDLTPGQIASLLADYPTQTLGINYDAGNSASLGYSWEEESHLYGDRISLVHIKDRVMAGASVPLGEGDADLSAIIAWLRDEFQGPVTMQAFRDEEGLGQLDSQLRWVEERSKS